MLDYPQTARSRLWRWSTAISEIAQSLSPRQEIVVGSVDLVFEAEICLVKATQRTCFLVPYSLILCFADMCASWFSVDYYSSMTRITQAFSCMQNFVLALIECCTYSHHYNRKHIKSLRCDRL